ncbi:MAG: sigma 54-interacting transcriptional regulator [Vicinamibacterales bacterium]
MQRHADHGHDARWDGVAQEAWRAARRGRHAQALRMCRAAAAALERRGDWAAAARARLMLARLHLERGDTARALTACAEAESVAGRAPDLEAAAGAALWRSWAQADAGEGSGAVPSPLPEGAGWAAAAWGVAAAVAVRAGDPSPIVRPEPDVWVRPVSEVLAPLVVAAWAARVEWLVAAGQIFRAGCAVAALRESVPEGDGAAGAEAALAHLRVVAATGDAQLVAPAVTAALRAADAAHLPWVRLRALAVWRDVAVATAAPEAGVLRTRARRIGARAPAGWQAAVAERTARRPDHAGRSAAGRPRPLDAGGRPIAGLVGESDVIRALRQEIVRAARTAFPVLIEGESGTGKELVARGLHALSPRSGAAFRGVNCAALADELVDAELFGHAKGAFTGALAARAGLIEEASGGTLFLDEIADLSLRAQAKLLRAFQEQEVRRVGEGQTRRVDVRWIAACNRSLDAEAAAGTFRADLLYRLAVIRIRVPPLRTRPGDVLRIVDACWPSLAAQAGTKAVLTPEVLAALERYAWPGNVRELQHVLATLAVHAPAGGAIGLALLPEHVRSEPGTLLPFAEARGRFEREYVQVALARHGASPTRAARAIGLSRQGLRKVLARTDEAPERDAEPR